MTFPTGRDLKLAGKIDEIGATGEAANTFPATVRLIAPTSDIRVGMAAVLTFGMGARPS